MSTQPLCYLSGGVVFKDIALRGGARECGFIFVIRLMSAYVSVAILARGECPEPHGREACVFFKAARVGSFENHCQGFLCNGSPNVHEVFLEANLVTVGLFYTRVAGK